MPIVKKPLLGAANAARHVIELMIAILTEEVRFAPDLPLDDCELSVPRPR
jgi:hypothetical protein